MSYRTHNCGELTARHIGTQVTLAGWVAKVRDLGGLIFVDLRDRYGKTQIVTSVNAPVATFFKSLHNEDVIQVTGLVQARPEGMVNRNISTGEIEVIAETAYLLNESMPLPLGVEDEEEASEEVRLRYRYLEMRRPRLIKNLLLRHRALQSVRRFHDEQGFIEVETPFLIRSTPEGARDYLVPSRVQPGCCYALPQSPQLYKQALIIGGIDRYFQIVRCFRDEDLRRDRQPEFTQIDIEMAFVDEEDVFNHTEKLMKRLVIDTLNIDIDLPLIRLDYDDAISRYGTDAPDLRYGLEIKRLDNYFRGSGFRAFEEALSNNSGVFGINAVKKGELSRRERMELEEYAKIEGLPGLLTVPVLTNELGGVLGKIFDTNRTNELTKVMNAKPGDLLLFVAGDKQVILPGLGRLRKRLAELWHLVSKNEFKFCWIVNPPLFEISTDGSLTAAHHPFTSPMPEDIDLLETEPLKVRSRAYDLVLNGFELGSGSIRIHKPELQERVLNAIGITREEAHRRFGFLLEALSYGAPPHGGIALGFDRIIMLLSGETSIREVIAFPKTNTAASLMDGAPTPIDDEQLKEIGIKWIKY